MSAGHRGPCEEPGAVKGPPGAVSLSKARTRFGLAAALFVASLVSAGPVGACDDADADGFFDVAGCGTPRDCNDRDASIRPGAPETCNGFDDDCDGLRDDGCDGSCDDAETVPMHRHVADTANDEYDLALTTDGYGLVYADNVGGTCYHLEYVPLNEDGEPLTEPVTLDGPNGEFWLAAPSLAWSGEHFGLAWASGESPECLGTGSFRVLFATLDPSGTLLSGPVRVDCGFSSSTPAKVLWNGREFAVFWVAGGSTFHYTRIGADGAVLDPCGVELPTGAQSPEPGSPSFAWNGDVYGMAYDSILPGEDPDLPLSNVEVFFQRSDTSGNVLPPGEVRVTDFVHKSFNPVLVWADDGWGVVWKDERDNTQRTSHVYFAMLDGTGTKLAPGDVALSGGPGFEDHAHPFLDLDWTGAEYGVAYGETRPGGLGGRLYFQRVGSDGTLPQERVSVSGQQRSSDGEVPIVWNGTGFDVLWLDRDGAQAFLTAVGCNCVDGDGDLFSTCAGRDCDDADPLTNPLAQEDCFSGDDENCDRLVDCQDEGTCPADPGEPPGEVTGVAFGADDETISWAPQPSADVYDLLTGSLPELRAAADFSGAECLAWRVAETFHTDARAPGPGDGFYYLVRGKADRCMLGTWGSPLRDEAVLVCP